MDFHADFPRRIVNEDKVNEDEGAREGNCKIEGGVGYDQTVFCYDRKWPLALILLPTGRAMQKFSPSVRHLLSFF
jgi:hypothetical protein